MVRLVTVKCPVARLVGNKLDITGATNRHIHGDVFNPDVGMETAAALAGDEEFEAMQMDGMANPDTIDGDRSNIIIAGRNDNDFKGGLNPDKVGRRSGSEYWIPGQASTRTPV